MNAQQQPAPLLPIPVGTAVRVSDGTPQPPARFRRKLDEWESHNYDGVVVKHNAPGNYTPIATYDIQHGDLFSRVLKVTSSCINPARVHAIPNAPLYEVSDGFDALVVRVLP